MKRLAFLPWLVAREELMSTNPVRQRIRHRDRPRRNLDEHITARFPAIARYMAARVARLPPSTAASSWKPTPPPSAPFEKAWSYGSVASWITESPRGRPSAGAGRNRAPGGALVRTVAEPHTEATRAYM